MDNLPVGLVVTSAADVVVSTVVYERVSVGINISVVANSAVVADEVDMDVADAAVVTV